MYILLEYKNSILFYYSTFFKNPAAFYMCYLGSKITH